MTDYRLQIRALMNKKNISLLSLTSCFLLLTSVLSGCIRLTGTAGYWKKGAQDEVSQGKSVTLDSQDLLYPNRAKGNITG